MLASVTLALHVQPNTNIHTYLQTNKHTNANPVDRERLLLRLSTVNRNGSMPSEPKPYNETQNVTQQGHAGFISKEGRSFYLGSVNL